MIKIGIVDDEKLFIKGLQMLISGLSEIDVVLTASNGLELLEKLNQRNTETPNIILLDLNMPKMDGVETFEKLKTLYTDTKVIVLTSHFKKAFVLYMLELGVSSFIPKDTDISTIERAIKEVHKNGFYYSQQVQHIINQGFAKKIQKSSRIYPGKSLTPRELDILNLICKQYTSKEIAKELFISPRTVEGYRNKLIEKAGCKNIAGLVLYAIQNGIIDFKPPRPIG